MLTYEGVIVNRLMGMSGGDSFLLATMWAFAIGGPAWWLVLLVRTWRLFENPQVASR